MASVILANAPVSKEETYAYVEVACVVVEVTISRLVMVDEAAFTRMPSPAVKGERKAPPSVQLLEPPPPIQAPSIAKHPSERSMPPAKVLVAFTSVTAREPAIVVVPVPVMAKVLVVALVEVAFTVTRLVIVLVAWLIRIVPKPDASEPLVSAPTEVSEEPTTVEPRVVSERTETPSILYARPDARLAAPEM